MAWVLALTFSAGLLPAQTPPKLAASAARQIKALRGLKISKSALQSKIDSRLFLGLLHLRNDARLAPLTDFRFVRNEADGRVPVDLVITSAAGIKPVLNKLEALGAVIQDMSYAYRRVGARVRLEGLETLAEMPEVRNIRQHMPAYTHVINVSEGDLTHGAQQARSFFGVNGAGVKVCVLSDGIDSLAATQASGDLPAVEILPGQAGSGNEGLGMLEIVHDLAPGATLAFATATASEASFAQNILGLAADGCDILVDDILYLDESPFEDGPVAQAVNTVTAADGVSVVAPGFNPFYGTSAAAPHAAALAALCKSGVPAITPAQLRTALIGSALDIEAPGVDRDTGAGIVMAHELLELCGFGPPDFLLDAPGAPVVATLPVAAVLGNIFDVDFRIDGTACSATAGSTTVGLDHTFVNDLELTLISPTGTQVLVINNTDGGGPSIQSVVTANAPFTGIFTPNAALSAFDGENGNGTWQLRAQDFFSQDTGNIRSFSVIITPAVCDPPLLGANVTATKTVSGIFLPGGTVTYTVNLTNNGGPQSDNPGNEFTDVLPNSLTLVSATATSGIAVATAGTNTVTWNGAIPAAGAVTITITATVNRGSVPSCTTGPPISNQGTCSYDSDANSTNDATCVTDDPTTPTPGDPTVGPVITAVCEIPTLSEFGLALLCLALAGAAVLLLRRRRTA